MRHLRPLGVPWAGRHSSQVRYGFWGYTYLFRWVGALRNAGLLLSWLPPPLCLGASCRPLFKPLLMEVHVKRLLLVVQACARLQRWALAGPTAAATAAQRLSRLQQGAQYSQARLMAASSARCPTQCQRCDMLLSEQTACRQAAAQQWTALPCCSRPGVPTFTAVLSAGSILVTVTPPPNGGSREGCTSLPSLP